MSAVEYLELTPAQAMQLERNGMPCGARLLERDELVWFESVYSRPQGSSLYVPESLDPIESYLPEQRSRSWGEINSAPLSELKALDLFAGCGGFSLGMETSGIDVVAAVEWDTTAALTYLMNLGRPDTRVAFDSDATEQKFWKRSRRLPWSESEPEPHDTSWMGSAHRTTAETMDRGCRGFFVGDVRKVSGADLLELAGVDRFDVIFGGPPCQGMSTSNAKRCIEDPRNALLWEYMRLVVELKPAAFVIENVPPLITWCDGVFINRICEIANEHGYNVVANIVDACSYGVPQHRRRALVVGTLGEQRFQFPMPTHWSYGREAGGHSWNMLFDDTEELEEGARRPQDDRLNLFEEVA